MGFWCHPQPNPLNNRFGYPFFPLLKSAPPQPHLRQLQNHLQDFRRHPNTDQDGYTYNPQESKKQDIDFYKSWLINQTPPKVPLFRNQATYWFIFEPFTNLPFFRIGYRHRPFDLKLMVLSKRLWLCNGSTRTDQEGLAHQISNLQVDKETHLHTTLNSYWTLCSAIFWGGVGKLSLNHKPYIHTAYIGEYLLYLRYLKCLMIMVFGICCDNVATHSPMAAMFFWPVQDRYPWMPGVFGSSPQWLQALIAIGFFGFSWQSCCGCTSMKNKQTCLSSLWQSFHVTLWSNDKCKDLIYIYK